MRTVARPLLSVVLPNYNDADLLPYAIEALLSQSRPADEIILIDDGSTDHSAGVISDIARNAVTVCPVLLPENQGAVACMNLGLSRARGDYVFFFAADDRIEPELFQIALDMLQRNPRAAMFCAEMKLMLPSGEAAGIRPIVRPSQRERSFDPAAVRKLLRGNDQFIATTTAVFKRDLLVKKGGFQESLGSMADTVCARELALEHGFHFVPRVLANHRINPMGLSRSTAQDTNAVLDLLSHGRAMIDSNPLYPRSYSHLFQRRMRFAVCRIALAEATEPAEIVLQIGARGALDRAVLRRVLRSVGKGRRVMALAWLALRLRPYSILQLVRTAANRTFESRSRGRGAANAASEQPLRK